MNQDRYEGTDNLEVMARAVRYNAFLMQLVRDAAGSASRILDFGAGLGTFAAALQTDNTRVACCEPDSSQAEVIRAHGLVAETDLQAFAPGSFAFAYSLNVLEHIEDDVSALRSLASRLEAGGKLLIYVPALGFLYSSMDRKVGHHRRYTRRSLRDALERAGLEVEHCRYADSMGVLATLAYKLVGSRKGDLDVGSIEVYDRWIWPLSLLFDRVMQHLAGKNVWAVARKPVERLAARTS